MEKMLDVNRRDFSRAEWHLQDDSGYYVRVDRELSETCFERFLELRSMMSGVKADLKQSFILAGWILQELKESKIYQYVCPKTESKNYKMNTGYSSFFKFVADVFGLKKKTAERMLAVAKEYCALSSVSDSGIQHVGVTLPYANYSYRQLVELLAIDEKYRLRIAPACSTRNIQRLAQLYRADDFVPKETETYEDDLKEWERRNNEKKAALNAKRNSLTFVPAQKVTARSPSENAPDQDDFDGEDVRDIYTDAVKDTVIPFDSIRNGLLRQLELLRENVGGSNRDVSLWNKFCDFAKDVLLYEQPEMADLEFLKLGVAAFDSERLNLKNKKEREEWLKNYVSWGVWISVPDVSKTFYRYNFVNGASIVVEVSIEYYTYGKIKAMPFVKYAVIDNEHPKYDSSGAGGVSGVIDWMTKHAKEI